MWDEMRRSLLLSGPSRAACTLPENRDVRSAVCGAEKRRARCPGAFATRVAGPWTCLLCVWMSRGVVCVLVAATCLLISQADGVCVEGKK